MDLSALELDDHLMSDGWRLRRSGGEAVRSYLGVGSFEAGRGSAAAAVSVPAGCPPRER